MVSCRKGTALMNDSWMPFSLTGGDDGAALKASDEVGAVGLEQLVHTNVEAKFK